jgi:hypothetical protein
MMADIDFDDFDQDDPVTRSFVSSRWVNLTGAACSVALVVGLVVWGYKLAVRDVNGVPVVRALEGPLRISPENPGGDFAVHQGLSVNAVAAVGTAAPLPETVTLAPEETALTAEDAAGLAVLSAAPASAVQAIAPQTDVLAVAPAASDTGLQPVEVAAPAALVIDTPALVDSAPVADNKEPPMPETQAEAVAAALAAALADGDVLAAAADPVAGLAVAKSMRPLARPLRAGASTAAIVPAPVSEVAASAIAIGTRLVQLGAFDTDAIARAEWVKLQARFPELIKSKSLVVQPAQSGGRDFYRLRAYGFESEDETRRFCAAMLAENASCIAVTQR